MLYTASGVLGEAPADKRCGAYWESKSAALVAEVFVDFPKNECNFLHKTSLVSYGGSNTPYTAAPYEEFFSWSSRHHCRV